MSQPRRRRRVGALIASAAVLVPVWISSPPLPSAEAATTDRITMTVDQVTPLTPAPTETPRAFSVELTLRANADITGVRIFGERGTPISAQSELDAAITHPTPPITPGLPIPSDPPLVENLLRDQATTVTFTTTTSVVDDGKGICICAEASKPLIYPLFFSAHRTGPGGVDQRLGVVSTFIPSFYTSPSPLHVSWIWPLLDRPHRLTSATQFVDDDLTASVGFGGRLWRALQVLEQLPNSQPITLLLDPELLDELWVMAHVPYTVGVGKQAKPGTGKDVAAAWLDRLHSLLESHGGIDVKLTPYGDPDVQTTTSRGLSWAPGMASADMTQHVTSTLAGRPLDSTLAWPSSGAITQHTLGLLFRDGVRTVVLDSAAVAGHPVAGLVRLQSGNDLAAALTSSSIERYIARTVTLGGVGDAALPDLIAELAVRITQAPDAVHTITLTAPRYVDPDVTAAVRAIRETSSSAFARPIALGAAVSGPLVPTGRSRLAPLRPSGTAPTPTLDAAAHAADDLPAIRSLLDRRDASARAFIAGLPPAIQRAESSAWHDKQFTKAATDFAGELSGTVDAITTGVRIASSTRGTYTLASSNADLPITVDNELPYPINVRVKITTIPLRLPGFSTKPMKVQHVDSKQKKTIKITTITERSGRIRINAVLLTPNDIEVGSQQLIVRSTALGFIGVVITIVAGVVLVLALVVRFAHRLRKRRRTVTLPLPPVPVEEPEPTP